MNDVRRHIARRGLRARTRGERGDGARALAVLLCFAAASLAPSGAFAGGTPPEGPPRDTVLEVRRPGQVLGVAPISAGRLSLAPSPEAVGAPPPEAIDEPPPVGPTLQWNPAWPKFSTAEWVVTGTAAALVVGAQVLNASPDGWRGKVGVDESVRDTLRPSSRTAQQVGSEVSDVFLSLMTTYPYAIDALVVAGWYRRNPEVALQMTLINIEAMAIATAINGFAKVFASRERPYGRDCGGSIDKGIEDCVDDDRYRSFYSGHATLAFTSAGLICSHHINLGLFGDPAADNWTCAAAFIGAGLTATMRIVGDKHYFTDTLTGAVLGTLIGLGVPWLFHYRFDEEDMADEEPSPTIKFMPTPVGAFAAGTF